METNNNIKLEEPFALFGIECGDGWKSLFKPIFDYIIEYNKDKKEDEKIVIHQLKEKFGGMRCYTNFCTDELRKIIDEAEEKSYNTCEMCGEPFKKPIIDHHWIYPMCQKCFDKMQDQRKKSFEEFKKKINEVKLKQGENNKN